MKSQNLGINVKSNRKMRSSNRENQKRSSLVKLFQEESRKMDEVLSNYDNMFDMSKIINSPNVCNDKNLQNGK